MTHRQLSIQSVILAIFLIASGALLRVLRDAGVIDLPPNFAPVAAMAMFGAVHLPRRLSLVIPFALMLISDIIIGFDVLGITIAIYLSFGISLLLGAWLKRRVTLARTVMITLLGSIIFFLVTNAAVWMFTTIYPQSFAGLMQSYISGLPFFRNTILGDLTYVGVLFGLYNAVVVYWKHRLPASEHALSHG